jgi:superfamily I DNA and/or RNA helicase
MGSAGFLREFRRVNVALSRAKDLLAIVGDHGFVERANDLGPLQRVLGYIMKSPEGVQIQSFETKGGH